MKILPHTAPYPFTLASLLGVSEHVDDHAVGVVCGLCLGGREWGAGCSPTAPGRCLHFECRGAPARVRAWRCEGRPPLPHHFDLCVCADVYLTLPYHTSRGRPTSHRHIAHCINRPVFHPGFASRNSRRCSQVANQVANRHTEPCTLPPFSSLPRRPRLNLLGQQLVRQVVPVA